MRLIRLTVDIALRGGCFVALVVAYSYAEVAGGAYLPAHVAPTLALFGCAALGAVCDGARVAWTALCLGAVGGLHLLRDRTDREARRMFSMAMWMTAIVTPIQIFAGDMHGLNGRELMSGLQRHAGAGVTVFGPSGRGDILRRVTVEFNGTLYEGSVVDFTNGETKSTQAKSTQGSGSSASASSSSGGKGGRDGGGGGGASRARGRPSNKKQKPN